ncbi:DinI family protein [Citrobacter sp. RHBSTW-00887]|nr:DinI family protein [Citrobacter sp. RHBSTW-00887]
MLCSRGGLLCLPDQLHFVNTVLTARLQLTKRVHRIFPDADVRVKPMITLPAINTDASKHEKEQISRNVQEMFEESDMWLVSD